MYDLCRLCQANKGTMAISQLQVFVNQVYKCTNIKIDEDHNDCLPKCICSQCHRTVMTFHSFLLEVERVDRELKVKLHELENKGTDKPVASARAKLPCSVCSKTYVRRKYLIEHQRIHPELYCRQCDKSFDDAGSRKRHRCSNDTSGDDAGGDYIKDNFVKFEGVTESKANGSDSSLNERTEGTFYLCKCGKNFTGYNDLELHQKEHEVSLVCSYENCRKVCTSAYSLRTHQMKHEGKNKFLCATCGKGFIRKNSLTCHEKIHAEVKAYACNICNIGFSVSSNLRAHQKKYHEGVRFYCSKCTRAFISKCSLQRHELVHTGIKEFHCGHCPAAFYTNKELVKHQRYHQELRQYKCEQCFKAFFEKHHLKIHMRYHTGARPYVCTFPNCGKSFAESQKLTRHVRSRHPA